MRRRDSLEELLVDARGLEISQAETAALDMLLAEAARGMDELLASIPSVADDATLNALLAEAARGMDELRATVADDAALNELLAEAAAGLDKLLDELR